MTTRAHGGRKTGRIVARVEPGAATLHIAGQLPVDEKGVVLHDGDFEAQAEIVWDMLATVLEGAGSSLSESVSVRAYITRSELRPVP